MKVLIGTIAAIALLVGGFFALNSYIYSEKQADPMDKDFEPYRAALSGEYVCLPHADTEGLQTDECAFGLMTDTGEYYDVDFYLMSQIPPELSLGDRFSANGVVTPIERLSTDFWRQYQVKAIFSVTDFVEKL